MARPSRVTIRLPTMIVDLEGGARVEEVLASDLAGALDALIAARPRLGLHLLDEGGVPRRHVRMALNDRVVVDGEHVELHDGDRITVLHSVAGG